jgi:RNA recognition motif 2
MMDSSLSPPFSPIAPSSPTSPTTPSSKSFGPRLGSQSSSLHTRSPGAPAPAPPPERNLLNIKRIEDGLDTRTTVMVKNIPNKMSDKDLLAFFNKVCYRRIDFLYLRMDFQNGLCTITEFRLADLCPCVGCNVGYAFVNFINVQDLLVFAKAKLGVKWSVYTHILMFVTDRWDVGTCIPAKRFFK